MGRSYAFVKDCNIEERIWGMGKAQTSKAFLRISSFRHLNQDMGRSYAFVKDCNIEERIWGMGKAQTSKAFLRISSFRHLNQDMGRSYAFVKDCNIEERIWGMGKAQTSKAFLRISSFRHLNQGNMGSRKMIATSKLQNSNSVPSFTRFYEPPHILYFATWAEVMHLQKIAIQKRAFGEGKSSNLKGFFTDFLIQTLELGHGQKFMHLQKIAIQKRAFGEGEKLKTSKAFLRISSFRHLNQGNTESGT
eukprot:403362444